MPLVNPPASHSPTISHLALVAPTSPDSKHFSVLALPSISANLRKLPCRSGKECMELRRVGRQHRLGMGLWGQGHGQQSPRPASGRSRTHKARTSRSHPHTPRVHTGEERHPRATRRAHIMPKVATAMAATAPLTVRQSRADQVLRHINNRWPLGRNVSANKEHAPTAYFRGHSTTPLARSGNQTRSSVISIFTHQ